MRFRLQIDPSKEEELLAVVHRRTGLIDRIEALILEEGGDRIIGYTEDDWNYVSRRCLRSIKERMDIK